jgi:hypothetical protein
MSPQPETIPLKGAFGEVLSMRTGSAFYLCSVCFTASEHQDVCHEHAMTLFNPGNPGDLRRRPLQNGLGRLKTMAPRWYLERFGWLPEEATRDS